MDESKVREAVRKIDELCLKCEDHKLTCYVAVARRAIATLLKNESKEARQANNENMD